MALDRRSGIILHPTSLPGPYGIGTLGQEAFNWINFLSDSGQHLWQVMPLGPTGYGDSPYQCFSAFAGNPYLINLEKLVEEGLLSADDKVEDPGFPATHVDYGPVISWKLERLAKAYDNYADGATAEQKKRFKAFCKAQAYWLDDYALFMAVKEAHEGVAWNAWDEAIRVREEKALKSWTKKLKPEIERQKVWQWLFSEQWSAVRAYANSKDIEIIGDIPIFIAFDSADAWANRELFYIDAKGNPELVAGVPPDYFSATGQRWGNPLYRWKEMKKSGYSWWIDRFKSTLEFVDIIRVDHFRGFEAYWEIPASEPTAVKGKWVKGPGQSFFDAISKAFENAPIIAEDLGVITPGVEALRDDNNLPGMNVLQFAFAADASDPYLPHNYIPNSVVYTGTHDNDTTRGWYTQASEAERDLVRRYLARGDDNVVWELVRLAFASVANTAVIPLQDALNLGSEARMNTPGQAAGNWSWRFSWEQIPHWIAPQLKELSELYGRIPGQEEKDTVYRQSVTE